jgi:hypothetical protein
MFLSKRGIFPSVTVTCGVSLAAPLLVHFDASATTAPGITGFPFHELYYSWDFDDTAPGTWTYGIRNTDKNVAYGPIAAHVYETAGTFTPVLTVRNSTGTIVETYTCDPITVVSANSYWSGANTVCINNVADADFSAKPTGATEVNSDGTFQSLIATHSGNNKRVLFKRGGAWTGTAEASFSGNSAYVGAYGSGDLPVITQGAANITCLGVDGNDQRVCELRIEHDTVTYAGTNAQSIDFGGDDKINRLICRCEIVLSHSGGASASCMNVASDITGTGLAGFYECLLSGGASGWHSNDASTIVAILGCNYENLSAGSGGHPLRLQATRKTIVANSRIADGKENGTTLIIHGREPLWNPEGYHVLTDNLVVRSRGGTISISAQNSLVTEMMENILVDAVFLENSQNDGGGANPLLNSQGRYVTIRNCIFAHHRTGAGNCMTLGWNVNSSNPIPRFIWVYNNSGYMNGTPSGGGDEYFIRLGTTSAASTQWGADGFVYNNIMYAPNATAPNMIQNTGSQNATVTSSNNSTDNQCKNTNPYVNASGTMLLVSDFELAPAVYAIGAGTTVPVYDDAAGVVRAGGTYDMGAFQYVA